jgi:hypothetical protein
MLEFDIYHMNSQSLRREVAKLRTAIRLHRDQRLDDRCWMDDYVLYDALPEKSAGADLRGLPKEEMLRNCEHYVQCRLISATPEAALELYRSRKREP